MMRFLRHRILRALKAVDKPVPEKWQRWYFVRWLTAPVPYPDGHREPRDRGTPQGGVISPLLATRFLHEVLDIWVEPHCQGLQWVRSAEDIIGHGHTEPEAQPFLPQNHGSPTVVSVGLRVV